MKIKLVVEHAGNVVTVEPHAGEMFDPLAEVLGGQVAGPNWSRLAQVAACVVSCLSATAQQAAAAAAAGKGGQHETPPADAKPAPPGPRR